MVTFMINEEPYRNNDKAWNALRLALNLQKRGVSVNIFLMDRGIDVGKSNHGVPEGKASLEKMLEDVLRKGGNVKGCKTCITKCSIKRDPLIEGVLEGNMDDLGDWVMASDKVFIF